ncbi:MAG: hypothetical protein J6E49_02925, partial [Acidaminococcaceae bacterium]|nr:hypothetical protein [Acidaminococcaceae bacterium]
LFLHTGAVCQIWQAALIFLQACFQFGCCIIMKKSGSMMMVLAIAASENIFQFFQNFYSCFVYNKKVSEY